jgi:hypothetical protein
LFLLSSYPSASVSQHLLSFVSSSFFLFIHISIYLGIGRLLNTSSIPY